MHRVKFLFLGLLLAIAPLLASAGEKQFGDYIVHYNAFPSDFLSPAMARTYGITRSRHRAILNISVMKVQKIGPPKSVDAKVEARAVNVYQQVKPLDLRRIEEPGAYYHIAEFPVRDQETVNFEITVHVDGQTLGPIKFQQQFFIR